MSGDARSDAPLTALTALTALLVALAVWAAGAAAALGVLAPRFLPPLAALACIALPFALHWRRWKSPVRAAALAAGLSLAVSVVSLQSMVAPDTAPTSQQPWELVRHGTLFLDDAPIAQERPHAFWLLHTSGGHLASAFPPGMALLAAPFYLPSTFAAPSTALLSQFDKCAASILSALAVLLLGLSLARAGSTPRWIFAGGILYGLASSALSLLSQTLWQQTGIALAVACALYAALADVPWLALLAALFAVLVRAPDLLLLVPLLLAPRARSVQLAAAAGALAGAALFLGYNALTFGGPFRTGYQLMQGMSGFTTHEWPESTVGLLLGPAHGLLWFCPWALLSLAAWRTGERAVRACLLSALALLALMSCWWAWWGGDAFGPRMLSEAQLPLAFALARAAPGFSAPLRKLTAALACAALLAHAPFPLWLARDPTYRYGPPWIAAGHPWVHLYERLTAARPAPQ